MPACCADVGEAAAVVAIQLVPAVLVADVASVAQAEAAHRARRVVDHEEIEIAVAIVVEKGRLRRVALVRDAVLWPPFP